MVAHSVSEVVMATGVAVMMGAVIAATVAVTYLPEEKTCSTSKGKKVSETYAAAEGAVRPART